jgi:hypothetical protein
MQIRRVETENRRDVQQFIRFPFALYKTCPLWVPPLISDMKFILNRRKHPFYIHSTAEFFLAESEEKTLGRLAVLTNRLFNDFSRSRKAFFYYFDTVDDSDVARCLFDAGRAWAREQGLDRMVGPLGFVRGDSMGLLVEGFEHRPAIGIPYNFSYYDNLVIQSGFERRTDYLSGYLSGEHRLPDRFYHIAEKVKARRGFWIKSFRSKRELRKWVPRFQTVVNDSFAGNFGHFPLGDAEAKVMAKRLLTIADPRLIKLVMKGEAIVGFLFVFVDISAALQKIQGRLWPLGWIAVLREFKKTKWVNFNGAGLLPGHRGVGANAVLYTEITDTLQNYRFEHADIVQIEENNIKIMGDMKVVGVDWYKKHRVYECRL